LGLEDEAPRPAEAANPVEDLQPRRRLDVRRAPARHELRTEGLPRRGRPQRRALRRAAPLHSGTRARAGLPRRGVARPPPAARARALALRTRALPARLPRPAH